MLVFFTSECLSAELHYGALDAMSSAAAQISDTNLCLGWIQAVIHTLEAVCIFREASSALPIFYISSL